MLKQLPPCLGEDVTFSGRKDAAWQVEAALTRASEEGSAMPWGFYQGFIKGSMTFRDRFEGLQGLGLRV